MDIAINPVSGVFRFPTPMAAAATATTANSATTTPPGDTQAQQTQASTAQAQDTGANSSATAVSTAIESRYEAAVQQIAQSFKGSYAVSDKDFTIFKDATGKYITRYVSLRDGSITYVPAAPAVTRLPSAGVAITA